MTDPQEIQQTVLSQEQLRDVLDEILKSDPGAQMRTREDPADHPLRDHLAGAIGGNMQIRYVHDGIAWIDTIMPRDAGTVTLIRAQVPQSRCQSRFGQDS